MVLVPVIHYNGQYKPYAQKLRREMTRQEKHLWHDFLRNLPVQVRRQKQFGDYIVDFYYSACNLVIELDGSQHNLEENREADRIREKYLESLGLTVVRFWNKDIDGNFDNVCAYLEELMEL